MSKEFEIRREVNLTASPETVWEAVATAAGNSAWLFPNDVDPAQAQAWDPPHHLLVRQEQGEWFNAIEFVIEPATAAGPGAVLRYTHSGIFVDDWDNQYDGVDQHTDFYLHTLDEYLRHFAGRRVTYVGDPPAGIVGPASSATPGAFTALQGALGLGPDAGEGDSVTLTAAGLEPISGVIDYRREHFLGVRSDDSLYRFFGRNAFGAPVGLSIHSFAPDADAHAMTAAWRGWLERVFA